MTGTQETERSCNKQLKEWCCFKEWQGKKQSAFKFSSLFRGKVDAEILCMFL